jgi:tetratricopeptide (TPR) repeat protein
VNALTIFVAQFPQSLAGRINLGAAYLARARGRAGTPAGVAEPLPILPEPGVLVRGAASDRDVRMARENFENALDLDAGDVLARAGLALAALRQNDRATAREQLAGALQKDPGNADLELCAGNIDFLDGQIEAARAHYLRALALSPGKPEARFNLARASERLGETQRSLELWNGLAADPRFGERARLAITRLAPEPSGAPAPASAPAP